MNKEILDLHQIDVPYSSVPPPHRAPPIFVHPRTLDRGCTGGALGSTRRGEEARSGCMAAHSCILDGFEVHLVLGGYRGHIHYSSSSVFIRPHPSSSATSILIHPNPSQSIFIHPYPFTPILKSSNHYPPSNCLFIFPH